MKKLTMDYDITFYARDVKTKDKKSPNVKMLSQCCDKPGYKTKNKEHENMKEDDHYIFVMRNIVHSKSACK